MTEDIYNTRTENMLDYDTETINATAGQLPSSVHPDGPNGAVTDLKRGKAGLNFRSLGVGFRVEGSGDTTKIAQHIARVTQDGMVPQVTLDWLMLQNGFDVTGTKVQEQTSRPRLNITQRDLWNESGVCVARSFLGATAFPYRWTKGNVILWAIDCRNLIGYDTEDYQLRGQSANGPWRPGEKAYPHIPARRILGYVIVEKLGNETAGWAFRVPPNVTWQASANGTRQQQDYIRDELAAWAGMSAAIHTDFDFAGKKIEYRY
jgi:hypothetical protein